MEQAGIPSKASPTASGRASPEAVLRSERSWLSRLNVHRFRNLRQARILPEPGPVVLLGENGAGKTNLLEAISLLTPGRGLRRARLGDLEMRAPDNSSPEGGGWAVAGRVESPWGPHDLGTGRDLEAAGGRERRLIRVDGETAASQAALGEVLAAVWVTPEMDGLFREGASERRRFLDRLVYAFDPAHAGRLNAYERALRERGRLLRDGRREPEWLAALERAMAERSVAIAAGRRELVGRLAGLCGQAEGAFPRAELALAGDAETWLDGQPALAVEGRLQRGLAEAREHDAVAGGAALGAHRSDLLVRHGGHGMEAGLCSTGEQKALLLRIVLAHARLTALERGTTPLLLLDEVAAHLDAPRRAGLYEEILAMGLQAWLTGTDAHAFAALGKAAQHYRLQDGVILNEE